MGSPAEREALQFAVEKFKENGCDTAYIMPFTRTSSVNTNSGIAIGIKRGATNRIIVIGGHIDSADPEIPGADDDGSGTAVVIEASRVLCSTPKQSTYVFTCFGGEEQGLKGSSYFVEHFKDIQNVVLMLQVDMANGLGTIDIVPETHGASAPRWLVKAAVEEFYKLGYNNLRYPAFFFTLNYSSPSGSGSDHESFLRAGIPAVDFSTDVSKPIHTPRDNFENFEQAGLKRSGDLVLKLAERFDGGAPPRATEEYFLLLIGQTPFFFPVWSCWFFVLGTLFFVAFVIFRIRRTRLITASSRRWTFLKMLLFSFIIVCCAWFSSNVVGLLNGNRYAWFADPEPFYPLSILGAILGICLSALLARSLPPSNCPYKHLRNSVALLFLFTIVSALASIKIALAPACALLLISVAMIVRNRFLKFFLIAVSPLWMFRFIFSEWKELIFRNVAMGLPTEFVTVALFNGMMVIVFTLYILPFLFAIAAVIRQTPEFVTTLRFAKSKWTFAFTFITFSVAAILLTNLPAYSNLWYRNIHADISYNMENKESSFKLKSSEYLDGVHVSFDNQTTTLNGRITEKELPFPSTFDSTLVLVHRTETKNTHGDTTNYTIELSLTMKKRPYRVSIGYSSGNEKEIPSISTPFVVTTRKNERRIEWYSFPETLLIIPVQFQVIGNDTVKEKISVVFSELPFGVKIEGEKVDVIPRMEYMYNYIYSR
ncbi:MAG: Zn-dependent exopeptidase M28 [Ignavibacteriae bacterium]|nr:Zn-dependent exopeptidase M28 [Ignavibacteriota bacterium]